jgi:signal transduction histidine kinase
MVDHESAVTPNAATISSEDDRVDAFVKTLGCMASGDVQTRLPLSSGHDVLDAIARHVNSLAGELRAAADRAKEAMATIADLHTAVVTAEARTGALLRAIPDLMFVLRYDGAYLDYHARDPKSLFVPPDAFIGRNVRDVLPPAIAELFMDALERASRSDDTVVVEYTLPMPDRRFYEARIVRIDAERLLSIVRDVTESKRFSELNRDLARRLISRQEVERQRVARELHDDVGHRVVLMNIELDQIAAEIGPEPVQARLRRICAQASEIAADVHHLSYELHPERVRTLGLLTALQALCRDSSNHGGVDVAFTHGEIPQPVDASVSLCLYRIAQEALHNVVRHSRARNAQVSVTCDERHIALQIVDTGVGFDLDHVMHAGLGLVSIRERAAILNGQLAIAAAPGQGTRITVRVPFRSPAADVADSTVPLAFS